MAVTGTIRINHVDVGKAVLDPSEITAPAFLLPPRFCPNGISIGTALRVLKDPTTAPVSGWAPARYRARLAGVLKLFAPAPVAFQHPRRRLHLFPVVHLISHEGSAPEASAGQLESEADVAVPWRRGLAPCARIRWRMSSMTGMIALATAEAATLAGSSADIGHTPSEPKEIEQMIDLSRQAW